jgi:hypothetical protein
MRVRNLIYDTKPLAIHAQGAHSLKPFWEPIRSAFFATEPRRVEPVADLTILTCNNGHPSLGLLEKSLAHLGLSAMVAGGGVTSWRNSIDKPQSIYAALDRIETEYVLFADSRDVILLDSPGPILQQFQAMKGVEMVFGADRMSWPPVKAHRLFERSIFPEVTGDFYYLNGGLWIGRTSYCRTFFAAACQIEPVPEAPDSEQGILRELFLQHYPTMQLDYRCSMFQNVGFVFSPILEIVSTEA